ncbi:hypothetical protein [Candidatus Cardinium hertigii]|uniref:hypothetical protein n=1 Tax=Candidatus Cardinium hertigii TaxID=247481 RepID=UPI003D7D6EDC
MEWSDKEVISTKRLKLNLIIDHLNFVTMKNNPTNSSSRPWIDRLSNWWSSKILKEPQYSPIYRSYNLKDVRSDDLLLLVKVNTFKSDESIQNNNTLLASNFSHVSDIFPSVIIDPESMIIYRSCSLLANVNDTRHLYCSHLVHALVKYYDNAKIVFLFNCDEIREETFASFFAHVLLFLPDIDINNFSDRSLMSVMTFNNSHKNCTSQEDVIKNLTYIFQKHKKELEENKKPVLNITHIENLYNHFSEKDDKEYKNIILLKKPDTVLILNSDWIVLNNTDPTNMLNKIRQTISSLIENIVIYIKQYVDDQEEKNSDIGPYHKKLKEAYESFKNIIEKLDQGGMDSNHFTQNLNIIMGNLDIPITHNFRLINHYMIYEEIINYINNDYYKTYRKDPINEPEPLDLINRLLDLVKYFNDQVQSYDYLIKLKDLFSSYDIQKDITQYTNSSNGLIHSIDQYIVGKESLDTVINNIEILLLPYDKSYTRVEEYNPKNITFNRVKLSFLKKILSYTLQHKTTCDNSKNKLVIKGSYVKLSDFEFIMYTSDFKPILKPIEVFSLNKVFIDCDFYYTGDEMQLSIIAPTWEIIGNKTITLDGLNREENFGFSVFFSREKDGAPGLPGISAVNFLGIGEVFINAKNLTISANGGKGGRGNDGKDGSNGEEYKFTKRTKNFLVRNIYCDPDGKNVKLRNKAGNSTLYYYTDEIYYYTKEDCDIGDKILSKNNRTYTIGSNISYIDSEYYFSSCKKIQSFKYNVYGDNGTKGYDGGKGGKGGKINLISLGSSIPEFVVHNYSGIQGEDGKGGKNGDTILLNYVQVKSHDYDDLCYSYWEKISGKSVKDRGEPGRDGGNDKNMLDPETVPVQYYSDILNEYAIHSLEDLVDENNIEKTDSIDFLKKLFNHQSVMDLYDTRGLVSQLIEIEKQYYRLCTKNSFLWMYESVLDTVIQRQNDPIQYAISEDDKIALIQLSITILSRIYFINSGLLNSLVLDSDKYRSLLINQLEKIKKFNNIESIIIINKENYKSNILVKNNQIKELIYKNFIPNVNKKLNQIDNDMKLLINEANNLKDKTSNDKHRLRLHFNIVKNIIIKKENFSIIQFLSEFLFILNPSNGLPFYLGITISYVFYDIYVTNKNITNKNITNINILSGVEKVYNTL